MNMGSTVRRSLQRPSLAGFVLALLFTTHALGHGTSSRLPSSSLSRVRCLWLSLLTDPHEDAHDHHPDELLAPPESEAAQFHLVELLAECRDLMTDYIAHPKYVFIFLEVAKTAHNVRFRDPMEIGNKLYTNCKEAESLLWQATGEFNKLQQDALHKQALSCQRLGLGMVSVTLHLIRFHQTEPMAVS